MAYKKQFNNNNNNNNLLRYFHKKYMVLPNHTQEIIKIYKIESEIKTKMRFYQLENKVSCLREYLEKQKRQLIDIQLVYGLRMFFDFL